MEKEGEEGEAEMASAPREMERWGGFHRTLIDILIRPFFLMKSRTVMGVFLHLIMEAEKEEEERGEEDYGRDRHGLKRGDHLIDSGYVELIRP